jgi:hypothetical protein
MATSANARQLWLSPLLWWKIDQVKRFTYYSG